MRARCTNCNAAIEHSHRDKTKLADKLCHCGGTYKMMKGTIVNGEAPVVGYTLRGFGQVYHKVYTSAGGRFLFNRTDKKFLPL